MKVRLNDIHNALDAVLRGRKSREKVAAWARACFRSDYDHRLTVQPAGERERIQKALSFLCDIAEKNRISAYRISDGDLRDCGTRCGFLRTEVGAAPASATWPVMVGCWLFASFLGAAPCLWFLRPRYEAFAVLDDVAGARPSVASALNQPAGLGDLYLSPHPVIHEVQRLPGEKEIEQVLTDQRQRNQLLAFLGRRLTAEILLKEARVSSNDGTSQFRVTLVVDSDEHAREAAEFLEVLFDHHISSETKRLSSALAERKMELLKLENYWDRSASAAEEQRQKAEAAEKRNEQEERRLQEKLAKLGIFVGRSKPDFTFKVLDELTNPNNPKYQREMAQRQLDHANRNLGTIRAGLNAVEAAQRNPPRLQMVGSPHAWSWSIGFWRWIIAAALPLLLLLLILRVDIGE